MPVFLTDRDLDRAGGRGWWQELRTVTGPGVEFPAWSLPERVRQPRTQRAMAERRGVLDQIEAGWNTQSRRPTAREIDAWMGVGRP